MRNKYATKPENWISNRNRFLGTGQYTQGPLRALPVINSQLRREKHPKGRFTRYDFDACDKLTTFSLSKLNMQKFASGFTERKSSTNVSK